MAFHPAGFVCGVSNIAQLLQRKNDMIEEKECILDELPRAGVRGGIALEGKRANQSAEVATGIEHEPPE